MTTAVRRYIQRYTVQRLPSGDRWGIYDRRMLGFCALPSTEAKAPALLPLDWPSPEGAQVWLYLCRVAWGAELIAAPEGWNGN
ncbi:hypothetical protein ACIGPN_06095 [Streptomyces afghaniensis]|uniref:hypothetical protein n=1 Tax=Streptomyces afghaniensis TaxID=66865 RepID=UPI0037D67869